MKINCALFLVFAVASNAQLRPPRPPPGNGDPLSRNPPIAPSPVPVPMTVEAEVVEANEVKSIDQVSPTQIVVSQLPSFPSPQPGVTVPRPDGCSPGCGANEICAKLGDSYCRMGQACSVCIRMDSIRIPTPALAAIFSSQKAVSPSPSPSSEPTISPFDLYGTVGLTGGNNRQANKQSNLLSKLERIRQKSTASQLPSDIQMERYLQRLATADTSAGTLKTVDTSTASGFNPGQANLGQLNLGQPNVVDYTSWLQFQQMKQTQNNTNGTADLTNGNINELWLQFNNFVKQKNQPGTVAGSTSGVNPSVLAVNTQTYVPTQQPAVNSDPFFGDMFGPSSTNSLYPMWPMFDMPLFGFGFF